MTRLDPIPRDDLPERAPIFELIEAAMRFVPTSMRVMTRWPDRFDAFGGLSVTVLGTGPLDPEPCHLVAHVASTATGCQYWRAHTAAHALHDGADLERSERISELGTADVFSEAERALLRFARDAAQQPSAVTDDQLADLKRHWSEEEILHALAVISLFGFLNRFSAALATTLEGEPLAVATDHLASSGLGAGRPRGHLKLATVARRPRGQADP